MAETGSVIAPAGRRQTHGAVSLLLAGSMCLLPFLIPYHQLPLRSFYPEWLAAALGVAAFATALASRRFAQIPLPVMARWLLGFACFLVVCAFSRVAVYPQMSIWAVTYVVYAALMIWLGAFLVRAAGMEAIAGLLAACVLVGALANAAAGIIQFYGRPDWLEDVVAGLRGIRAYGNIAQSNLYANYLALGQAALLFLWTRGRMGRGYAWCAAALLVWATALSDSRAALLYCMWFAALAAFAARGSKGAETRRLRSAAFLLAAGLAAAYVAVPWCNGLLGLGPPGAGTDGRLLNTLGDLRWQAWALALRMFAAAPFAGVGIGEFAGAAFEAGLPRAMTDRYEVWTSPHNQVLQLLAETGAAGTLLVLAGFGFWCRDLWRHHRRSVRPATWWLIAAVGVELIHSLLEFPLWSAHFLGVTTLLMGTLSVAPDSDPILRLGVAGESVRLRPRVWGQRAAGAVACAALAGILTLGARDYWRLDLTRTSGGGSALAGVAATPESAILGQLGHGLLAPIAEFWLCVGAPLDRNNLAQKLRWSERVMRYFPADVIVARRAIFLALDRREGEAGRLIDRLALPSPEARREAVALLRRTESVDQAVVARLVARVGHRE